MKKPQISLRLFAVRTGLEPATPCVTGTYSNQLNYRTVLPIHRDGAANIVLIRISANKK